MMQGGGGITPDGELWVNVTSRNGTPMRGSELNRLIAFFRARGFQPINYRMVWDEGRHIWIMIFQAIQIGGKTGGRAFLPLIPMGYYWDYNSGCMLNARTGRPLLSWQVCRSIS